MIYERDTALTLSGSLLCGKLDVLLSTISFGVSAQGSKLNLLRTQNRASFISKRANRIPMQLRGPWPNGKKVYLVKTMTSLV